MFVLGVLFGAPTVGWAQAGPHPVFDATGFQQDRHYFSQLPFEHIDTATGGLILTFTDLVLPGNGGRDLRFQRSYNSKNGLWTFGIAGIVLVVGDSYWPDGVANDPGPTFFTVDGGGHRAATPLEWIPDNLVESRRIMMSDRFWKYDRSSRTLWRPDGSTSIYDSLGRLVEMRTPFTPDTPEITVLWDTDRVKVTQHLGSGQERRIVWALPAAGNCQLGRPAVCVPATMKFDPDNDGVDVRTWTYSGTPLASVAPPTGGAWQFEYGDTTTVTTPYGGKLKYTFETLSFPTGRPGEIVSTIALRFRETEDVRGDANGMWEYIYNFPGPDLSNETKIVSPSDTVTTIHYNWWSEGATTNNNALNDYVGRTYVATRRTIHDGTNELEREDLTYEYIPIASANILDAVPELKSRMITREGRPYATTFSYSPNNFGDFHTPYEVNESGNAQRLTTREFFHSPNAPEVAPFMMGKPTLERVTANGDTFETSWEYEATGFQKSETRFGTRATFEPDGFGNVAKVVKGNGNWTSFTYSWGRVQDTITPRHVVDRVINADGTVRTETGAGRTAGYNYDMLGRLKAVDLPGNSADIAIDYDDGSGTITRTRGGSVVTATLDGFGRPIRTENAVGVRTRTAYDAEGRATYQSYPFEGAFLDPAVDIGTKMTYDGLGRVTKEEHPDGSARTREYGDSQVVVRDEKLRPTELTHEAFGNPDEVRLVGVRDATQQQWTYEYNGLGRLTNVTAPDDIARVWRYEDEERPDLLTSETHPESGTTIYNLYDLAGNLKKKTDANGTILEYDYDDNDRLAEIKAAGETTTFTYEPGSDNRATITNATAATSFHYDDAGRPDRRQDTVGPYVFTSEYDYDGNDAIAEITYPSGRKIRYDTDDEQRITRVFEEAAGRDYAFGMTYHPSGGVKAFWTGSAAPIQTTIGYDPQRYWVTSIAAGSLMQLTYGPYDRAGNVEAIADARIGTQTFSYDPLDRLKTAESPFASILYAYDAHGNRATANGTTYEYESGTLRLQAQSGIPYTYFDNGNLKTKSGDTFTYTPENWLRTASVSGTTTTYGYDADGWRVRKAANGETLYYLRGLRGELLTEWRKQDATAHERDYVYAGSRLLSAIDRTSNPYPTVCGGRSAPDGSPTPVTIASGATESVTFEGSACRRVSVKVNVTSGSFGCSWTVRIVKPDQTPLTTVSGCGAVQFIEPVILPMSGEYRVVVDPAGTASGVANVAIYDVVDISGEVSVNGPTPVTLTTPGQRALLTFVGATGQRVSLRGADITVAGQISGICPANTSILDPDETLLPQSTQCMKHDAVSGFLPFMDVKTLPADGTYTIVVDPLTTATGNVTLTLYDVPPDATGTIAPGTPVTVPITTPGQNGRYTFSAAAGQRVSLVGSNVQMTGSLGTGSSCTVFTTVKLGESPVAGSNQCMKNNPAGGQIPFMDVKTLLDGGTYTVFIDPANAAIGSLTLTLHDVPADVADTITPGEPKTVVITTPGRNARLTFTAAEGQRVSLVGSNVQIVGSLDTGSACTIFTTLLKPDDAPVSGSNQCMRDYAPFGYIPFMDVKTLTAGSHTILVDPMDAATGSLTLLLHDVPPDATGTVTIGGSGAALTTTTPGQNGVITLDGAQGQAVTARVSGNTVGTTTVKLTKADGTQLTTWTSGSTSFNLPTVTLPATGSYRITIDPNKMNVGGITVAATNP